MIRRLAPLVLSLLFAAPALSQPRAKLMLVQMPHITNPSADTQQEKWTAIQGMLRQFDADYILIPWQSTKGLWMKQGKVYTASGTEVAVDGLVFVNYVKTRWSTVDSMTLARTTLDRWPDVDALFYGTGGGVGWADAAACSTGIRTGAPSGENIHTHGVYLVGHDYGWHDEHNDNTQIAARDRFGGAYGGNSPPFGDTTGVWRGLIGVGSQARTPTGTWVGCEDCNAILRQADPDTVTAWWRSRSDASGNPTGSRLIFVESGNSAGLGPSINLLAVALGKMDSLIYARTGKRLINRQITESIFVDRWFAQGNAATGNERDTTNAGMNIADSTYVKATLDSLNELSDPGFTVPITFLAEMDSLDAFAWQDPMMRRVANFYVSPISLAGAYGVTGSHSAGQPGRFLDLLGTARDRSVQGAGGLGVATAPTDSSIEAKFYRADSVLQARYPGRVDRLVYAARSDWSPRSVTRSNATQMDTLHAVLYGLGYRGYASNPMAYDTDPGRGRSGGAAPVRVRGYASHQTEYQARNAAGSLMGYMRTVPSRGCENCDGGGVLVGPGMGHNNFQEHSLGLFTGEWYGNRSIAVMYEHQFQARTRMIRLPANILGDAGAGTNRYPYWYALWAVMRSKAVNAAAGRTVMKFVTGQEIAKEPIW